MGQCEVWGGGQSTYVGGKCTAYTALMLSGYCTALYCNVFRFSFRFSVFRFFFRFFSIFRFFFRFFFRFPSVFRPFFRFFFHPSVSQSFSQSVFPSFRHVPVSVSPSVSYPSFRPIVLLYYYILLLYCTVLYCTVLYCL